MDSGTSCFLLSPSSFHSVYYQAKENDSIIDLGLSLKTLEPEAYQPSVHPNQISDKSAIGMEGYYNFTNLSQKGGAQMYSSSGYPRMVQQDYEEEEADGIQNKDQWSYIKVNMDDVVVGRKVCIFSHSGYASLAFQLEDMFGHQSSSGLRLFQEDSEFSVVYKDGAGHWREVGDVPWKEFITSVKRLRIMQRN